MSLAAIAIEPSYIALDARDFQDADEVERRIVMFTMARRLIATSGVVSILTSEQTNTALYRANYYPYNDRLSMLLSHFGLDSIYSANDVRVIIQDVIERSTSLEKYIGVDVALYDDPTIVPACTEFYSDDKLLTMFGEIIGIVAAGMKLNANLADVIRICAPAASAHDCIKFSGALEVSEPDLGFCGALSMSVFLTDRYNVFIRSLDGRVLWSNAVKVEDFVFALFVGAVQRKVEAGTITELSDVALFAVGSGFSDSLVRNQASGAGRYSLATYERTVSIICGRRGGAMWHGDPVRRKQRVRGDGAIAWRAHVTSRHEALRLMYWTVEGRIEFANVGKKSELTIVEGDGQAHRSIDLGRFR